MAPSLPYVKSMPIMNPADKAFQEANHLAQAGQWQQAVQAFSRCLQLNPQDWQALVNRANAYLRLQNTAQALEDYLAAAALNPQSSSIKCNLAVLLKELGELALAESLLNEVLAAEPEHADAWSNLGTIKLHQRQHQDAIACHLRALALAGPSAARYNNLGYACTNALLLEDAINVLQGGLAETPQDANLRFSLAVALLLAGRYAEAWPYYEARWEAFIQAPYQAQRWQGQALGHSRLLLWAEQGLGDSLQMVRFLPVLQAQHPDAQLLLACPASFHRLFSQFAPIELFTLDQPVSFDWQLPLMSLPGVLDITLENLPTAPYLTALSSAPIASSPDRLRVGVVWESGRWGRGKDDMMRQQKSIPAEQFASLCQLPGIDYYSLCPSPTPTPLQGLIAASTLDDFADTAALIASLDLVISVDTAVVHLAGAMGKPVWVLMRAESAPFFMAQGDQAPWYPSATLWRQPQPGDWETVLTEVTQALADYARSP